MHKNKRISPSIWSPLRQPLFRTIWIMSLVSNVGSWMQEVGGGWLMTSLTTSPALVGLLETALTLPLFILSLPAGALADILDKRRILIATQTWMTIFAAAMGIVTLLGGMTPLLLLILTFIMSIGSAVNSPPWQAILPEIIAREELPAAVALGSVGFNLARAIGPALGGAIIVALGPGATFLFNAISFLGVIIVLYRWKREHRASVLPAERMMGAMRAGVRYVRHAPMLQSVLVRTLTFILFGSAMWALLPFIAKHELHTDSLGYGTLIACFGVGAVIGAGVLTRVRLWLSVDAIVRTATVMFTVLLISLAIAKSIVVVCCAMLMGGSAWMMLMSSLNLAAQLSTPPWVRARAMAIYILVFFGGFAGGAALWGGLATQKGTTVSLLSASFGAIVGLLITTRFKLVADISIDHTPSMHWAEPVIAVEPEPDQGPVMITVEYVVDPADEKDFSKAIHELSRIRKRDGAVQWGIFNDVADARRYVETFVVESWIEHLRQHGRVTITDKAAEEIVHKFHKGISPPKVEHFIYTDEA